MDLRSPFVRKTALIAIVALVAGLALWWQLGRETTPTTSNMITNFAECVAAGYTVTTTTPRVCKTPDGGKFVEPKNAPSKNTNAATTNTSTTNKSTNATNGATNSPTTTRGDSHYGVHTGSLTYTASLSYAADLGSIWIRDGGATNYRDDYGWGKTGYRNPAARTPLPSFQSNAFIGFEPNRYDDTQPKSLTATYPEGHEQNFRDYINYLLSGYKNKISYWEVSNEVDFDFWGGTAQDYARTVSLASDTIKPQCSSCKVAVSFSRPAVASEWYSAVSGICSAFDVIDVHLIEGFFGASFIEPGTLDQWKRTCPGKEFVSTETGIPDYRVSGKPQSGGSPELQAQDLIKYNTKMFVEGYNVIFWYLIDTTYGEAGAGNAIFEHNALVTKDGTKKAAFTAYKTMIEKTDYFTSVTKLADGQYKYVVNGKNVYVLWCDSGSCSVPSSITGSVTVTDYLGTTTTQNANQIRLTASPVYVQ